MTTRFASSVVMVTGGSGVIGSGAVGRFLKEGATVIAPVRSEKSAGKVRSQFSSDKLDVQIADVSDESQASQLAMTIKKKYGSLNHIVTSVGSWWQGAPVLEQTTAELQKLIQMYGVSQFVAFKTFAPLLKDEASSSYTIITGGAAEASMKGSDMVTIAVGPVVGLSIVARSTYQDKAPRINEFRIMAFIKPDEEADMEKGIGSNAKIGELIADLAASDKKGELVHIERSALA